MSEAAGPALERLDAAGVRREAAALAALLIDVVDAGASVGFLPPLDAGEAGAYWDDVAAAVAGGSRIVLVARAGGRVIGTVQLDLATRANGRHRAEVVKLMVHPRLRRHGLGRRLMAAVETEARRAGRSTLVLDTRVGDPSEALYRGTGWVLTGIVPEYAESAGGALDASAFYHKLLR